MEGTLDMVDLFNATLFRNFLIPFVTVVLSIFLKMNSRSDSSAHREDFAVGFELLLTSVVIFLIGTFDTAKKIAVSTSPQEKTELLDRLVLTILLAFMLFFFTACLSLIVRRYGWEDREGSTPTLSIGVGIVIPLIVGTIALIAAGLWGS
jgi:hypothetical protein